MIGKILGQISTCESLTDLKDLWADNYQRWTQELSPVDLRIVINAKEAAKFRLMSGLDASQRVALLKSSIEIMFGSSRLAYAWDDLAESGLPIAVGAEEAIFLYALNLIRETDPNEMEEVVSPYLIKWARQLPSQAFNILREERSKIMSEANMEAFRQAKLWSER